MSNISLTEQAIAKVQTYQPQVLASEHATLQWVILPLLQAMGYSPSDITLHAKSATNHFPDITLQPLSAKPWFLEAKAWNVNLIPNHVHQALGYPNIAGGRWAVLTNGQEWRLYDNDIKSGVADKFVVSVKISDSQSIKSLLDALSLGSFSSGETEKYAQEVRLTRFLQETLTDPKSATIAALHQVIQQQPGLNQSKPADLVNLLSIKTSGSVLPVSAPVALNPTAVLVPPKSSSFSLEHISLNVASCVTGRKPLAVVLPDGTKHSASSWKAAAVELVKWLSSQQKLPSIPFQGGKHGKRIFINSTPQNNIGPMSDYVSLPHAGSTIYVCTKRSGEDFVKRLHELCQAASVDPKSVELEIS